MKYLIPFVVYVSFYPIYGFEKIQYQFTQDPIDVVIPCHEKDAVQLERAIEGVKKNVKGLRRIIVISSKPFTRNAEWASEQLFPFSKQSIIQEALQNPDAAQAYLHHPHCRAGWIYQQFLKLFAAYYIPNISSNILIVDADVVFLKPVSFLQENGAGLYAVGTEYHKPYFEYAARLLPGLNKLYPQYSGIAHHMLFQKPVLDDLFEYIHKKHQYEPWVAIARAIPMENGSIAPSALSEYEIYFNFVFARSNQVKIRPLRWKNISESRYNNHKNLGHDYDYVAIHIWEKWSA
jgi:hypothetical protein